MQSALLRVLSLTLSLAGCAYDWSATPHADGGEPCSGASDCEPRDGGLRDASEPAPDASEDPGPSAALLLGTYALRIQSYGRDMDDRKLSQQGIMIAEISGDPEDGELAMSLRFCQVRGEALPRSGSKLTIRTEYAERLPMRQFTIALRDGGFHTEGAPLLVGYLPEPPAGCTPGAQLKRATEWGDTCTCPARNDVPPTSASDCRVIDGDGDGEPGITTTVRAGAVVSESHLRSKDMSQLVSGEIVADRHHTASYVQSEETFDLKCSKTYCPSTTLQSCAERLNRAMFAPLEGKAPSGGVWTCADVVTQIEANKLLPVSPLAFPTDC